MAELRTLIAAEETRFKYAPNVHITPNHANVNNHRSLASEIDEIRAGKWDYKILPPSGRKSQEPTLQTNKTPPKEVSFASWKFLLQHQNYSIFTVISRTHGRIR